MSNKLVAYFSAFGVTAKVAETLAEAIRDPRGACCDALQACAAANAEKLNNARRDRHDLLIKQEKGMRNIFRLFPKQGIGWKKRKMCIRDRKEAVQNREVGDLRKSAIKECADKIRTLQKQNEQHTMV